MIRGSALRVLGFQSSSENGCCHRSNGVEKDEFMSIIGVEQYTKEEGFQKMQETLQAIDMFKALTEEQIATMETFSEVITCKKDEKLFQVGHLAKYIYVLLDGKVSIQVQLSSRPENMSIVVLQKFGQLVGWSGLMGGSHYTANGVCLEDSQLLRVDGREFMSLLEQHPETGFIVMREISMVISQRLRNLQSVVLKTI